MTTNPALTCWPVVPGLRRVWRIQHGLDNSGPYQTKASTPDFVWAEMDAEHHPTPENDETLCGNLTRLGINTVNYGRGYRFGFTDIESLRKWWNDKKLKALSQHGFKLAILDIHHKDVILGNKQCMFVVNSPVYSATHSLELYFGL